MYSNLPAKLKSHRFSSLLLVLAILSLFWPVFLNPYLILHPTFSPLSDILVIHWPKAHLMAQSWQAGEGLPYWNPLILSGMPLAANQLAMLFYPPAWLFLAMPIEPVFNLLFIFHLLLGGFGIYLLLSKAHRLSPTAALCGGLTFALNGKWLAHAVGGHVSLVGAVGWMPWTLLGVMMLLRAGGRIGGQEGQPARREGRLSDLGWAALAGVTLGLQIVTHTLPVIYSVYLIGAMVAWRFVVIVISAKEEGNAVEGAIETHQLLAGVPSPPTLTGKRGQLVGLEIKRLILPLALIPILAALLGAGQLLPLLELSGFSNRSLSLAQAAEFSVSPIQLLIGLLLPSTQGGHELIIYLGLLPLLLAPFGLTRRRPWSWFYGGLFIFTVLFALGPATPVHSIFYTIAPGFRWVRTPARIFFVAAIAVAALVGYGIDQLRSNHWSAAARRWLTRLALAIGLLALLLGLGLAFGFDQLNRATVGLALFIPLGLVLILLRVREKISARPAGLLLGLLLFLDLASFGRSMIRFVTPAEALAPGQAAAEYLARQPGYFRVYSPSYSLPAQTAAAYGLHLADGVEPVHLAIYDRYMAAAGGYGDASFSVTIPNFGAGNIETALKDTQPDLKLLGLLNVEYLVSAFPMAWPGLSLAAEREGAYIYTNQHALPRAWVVHQTAPAADAWLDQLAQIPDLAKIAAVEDPSQFDSPAGSGSVARISYYSADRLEIEAEIEAPGWLILSEIWYPGWQATVNDIPQPVKQVNGLLRGLYLDQPGRHQIRLTYQPQSVVWGVWIAGVAAGLILLVGLGWGWLAVVERRT